MIWLKNYSLGVKQQSDTPINDGPTKSFYVLKTYIVAVLIYGEVK